MMTDDESRDDASDRAPSFGSDSHGFQDRAELGAFLALIRAEIARLESEKRQRASKKGGGVEQMVIDI